MNEAIFTRRDGILSKAFLNPSTGNIDIFDWWDRYQCVGSIWGILTVEQFGKIYEIWF